MPIPSVQRFLRVGTVSLGIPSLLEMVLTSAGLCSIHTSDAIWLASCLCHEWTLTNLFTFLFSFFFYWREFTSHFHSFQLFTIYGQGFFSSFARMKCDDVVVHPPVPLPGPALRSPDNTWTQLSGEGSPSCISWAVRCSLSLRGALVEVGTTRNIPAKVVNKG